MPKFESWFTRRRLRPKYLQLLEDCRSAPLSRGESVKVPCPPPPLPPCVSLTLLRVASHQEGCQHLTAGPPPDARISTHRGSGRLGRSVLLIAAANAHPPSFAGSPCRSWWTNSRCSISGRCVLHRGNTFQSQEISSTIFLCRLFMPFMADKRKVQQRRPMCTTREKQLQSQENCSTIFLCRLFMPSMADKRKVQQRRLICATLGKQLPRPRKVLDHNHVQARRAVHSGLLQGAAAAGDGNPGAGQGGARDAGGRLPHARPLRPAHGGTLPARSVLGGVGGGGGKGGGEGGGGPSYHMTLLG